MQQAREKFMSLRKSTRIDIATVVEEVGHVVFSFGILVHEYCLSLSWVTMTFSI